MGNVTLFLKLSAWTEISSVFDRGYFFARRIAEKESVIKGVS